MQWLRSTGAYAAAVCSSFKIGTIIFSKTFRTNSNNNRDEINNHNLFERTNPGDTTTNPVQLRRAHTFLAIGRGSPDTNNNLCMRDLSAPSLSGGVCEPSADITQRIILRI